MKLAERGAFNADLVCHLGRTPLEAQLLPGGDLLIEPADKKQQDVLLILGECVKMIPCSVPKALTT